MSTTHIPTRRVAARNAADRRKKLLLVGLFALLAAVLAFQLPKLLNSSGSSSSSASTAVATPATSAPAPTGGTSVGAGAATSAPAKGAPAIGQMTSHDPFLPVTGASAPASSSSSASAPTSASSPSFSSSSAPASAVASQTTSQSTASTAVPTALPPSSPAAGGPAVASPATPTAAVIWTNGTRQVVGVGHTFAVGNGTFEIAAVDGATMRLQVPDGSFTGGKHTITIRKDHEVTLENNATGVLYTLRFTGGTSNGS
jgi:hypothetical protein